MSGDFLGKIPGTLLEGTFLSHLRHGRFFTTKVIRGGGEGVGGVKNGPVNPKMSLVFGSLHDLL